MRLFVAIQLTDEMKKSITGTLHALKQAGVKGNYVPLSNLHLTLAFIGETDDPGAVKEALKDISWKPFRLSLSELGTFGDILWVGMKGKQGLTGVVRDLRAALEQAGVPFDGQKFVPHITLIRKMSGKWQAAAAPKGDMMVKKISLMKSAQKDGKTVYTEIFSV